MHTPLDFFLFPRSIFFEKCPSRWSCVLEEASFARRCWSICTQPIWPTTPSPMLQSRISSRVYLWFTRRREWWKGRSSCVLFFVTRNSKTLRSTVWINGSRWSNNAPLGTPFQRREIILLPTQYRNYSREDQGRGHHLVSGKSIKHFFIHGTERKIFYNFSNRGMTLMTTTTVCPRMILSAGWKIYMPQDRLGVDMTLIIGHVWMWLTIEPDWMDFGATRLSLHRLFIRSSCVSLAPISMLL